MQVFWEDDDEWYDAKVTSIDGDEDEGYLYGVLYSDGDTEAGLRPEIIRLRDLKSTAPAFNDTRQGPMLRVHVPELQQMEDESNPYSMESPAVDVHESTASLSKEVNKQLKEHSAERLEALERLERKKREARALLANKHKEIQVRTRLMAIEIEEREVCSFCSLLRLRV